MYTEKDRLKERALQETMRDAKRGVGCLLSNGAIIVKHGKMHHVHSEGSEGIVLAIRDSGPQPYVTWRRMIGVQSLAAGGYGPIDYCYSGDYFSDLDEAVKDFNARSNELVVKYLPE